MEINKQPLNELRVTLAIQTLGKATDQEIYDRLIKEGFDITLKKVQKATTNVQKRGLISINYDNSSGYAVKAYSMSKSIFSRGGAPLAHYKDIIKEDDIFYKEFIESYEQKKNINKGRLPDHRDYNLIEITFEVLDKVLGFMPFTEEGFMEHYREDGNIILLPSHFRAWVGLNLRLINKSDSLKNYIGFNKGIVTLKGKTEIVQFPILDGNQGRGINKFEVLPKGTIIKTCFQVPDSDFPKEEFMKFLKLICSNPIRGFGGRSMTGYGHLKIVEI